MRMNWQPSKSDIPLQISHDNLAGSDEKLVVLPLHKADLIQHTYQNINETTLSQGRAVSSLKLYAQAKLRLIDSCQNGTCADPIRKLITWAQVHDLAFRQSLQAGLKCLKVTVDSPFCPNIRHPYKGQLTAVKLEHPLAVITWLYCELIFIPIEVTYFLTFSSNV